MVFSSIECLWFLMPLVLAAYLVLPFAAITVAAGSFSPFLYFQF